MGAVLDMAEQERKDLADFLDTLTPEQWQAPSLCTGWTVRQVVAHLISYDDSGVAGTLRRLVRARFNGHRMNELSVADYDREPEELVALVRKHQRPHAPTTALGGMIALLDATIHHQDIRRPLGIPREIPAERLRTALRLALHAPPIQAGRRARGLTLIATDIDWSHGNGPPVRGPGEALLMAIAGRTQALESLNGPGREILAKRMPH